MSGGLNGVRAQVLDYVGATRHVYPDRRAAGGSGGRRHDPVETHDTGRSQLENVTRDNTPIIRFRLDDAIFLHDLPGNPANNTPPDEVIPIPFSGNTAAQRNGQRGQPDAGLPRGDLRRRQPQQPGQLPQMPLGFARQLAEGVYEFDFARRPHRQRRGDAAVLTDGSHFLSARVQMVDPADNDTTAGQTTPAVGFGDRSVSLEIVVDTSAPPVVLRRSGRAQPHGHRSGRAAPGQRLGRGGHRGHVHGPDHQRRHAHVLRRGRSQRDHPAVCGRQRQRRRSMRHDVLLGHDGGDPGGRHQPVPVRQLAADLAGQT